MKPVSPNFRRKTYTRIAPEVRFWAFVEKSDGCWVWTGALSKGFKYGMFDSGDGVIKAHRFSYRLHNGEIPEKMFVCHRCDNPACVRPDHLFLGDSLANNSDMTKKERHGRMKFTHEQVRRIRVLREKYGRKYLPHRRIADWFGVSKSTITHMLSGRNWIYA